MWLQQEHESGARFCYVDECGHGSYTARTRGRSVIGEPARRIADNQRTPHITLLCAITPSLGLIHSKMIIGGAKQGDFDGFISELFQLNFGSALVTSEGVTKQYIILDNAPCHRGVEDRLAESIPTNTELIRLPPYSCELNPIVFFSTRSKLSLSESLVNKVLLHQQKDRP